MAKKSEVAKSSRELKIQSLSRLKPYENNPRIIEKAIPKVAESIKQCGYITPIVVDEDNVILAGHTRYEALKSLGIDRAKTLIVRGLSEEEKGKYRLLDNKTGEIAKWDRVKLREELVGIDFEGFDFGQIIFYPEEEQSNTSATQKRTIVCPRCKKEVLV